MKGSYIVSEEDYRKAIKERDDARNAYNDTKAANTKLTEELGLVKKENEDLKKKAPKADVTELQKKLTAAQDEAKKAKDEGVELQKKLTAAENEAKKAKDEGVELQKKLTAAENEAEKAKNENVELQEKLAAAQDEANTKKAKSDGSARLRRLLQNNPERTAAARPYIEAIRNNRKELLGLMVQWEDQDSEEENFLDGIF